MTEEIRSVQEQVRDFLLEVRKSYRQAVFDRVELHSRLVDGSINNGHRHVGYVVQVAGMSIAVLALSLAALARHTGESMWILVGGVTFAAFLTVVEWFLIGIIHSDNTAMAEDREIVESYLQQLVAIGDRAPPPLPTFYRFRTRWMKIFVTIKFALSVSILLAVWLTT
jgi:hypothetical protein